MNINALRAPSSGQGHAGLGQSTPLPISTPPQSHSPDDAAHAAQNAQGAPITPSRYGAYRRPNFPALAASVASAAFAFSALMAGQAIVAKTKIEHLNILSIEAPPPPPPPPEPQRRAQQDKSPPQITLPPAPLPPSIDAPRIEAVISAQIPPSIAPVVPQSDAQAPAASTAPAAANPPAMENAGDISSTMISATPPRYPTESRRLREQGVVVLRVILGPDGRVSDIHISKSSGHYKLDQAALSAVRRWRWSPTLKNGTPVSVKGLVEIPFVLQEKP